MIFFKKWNDTRNYDSFTISIITWIEVSYANYLTKIVFLPLRFSLDRQGLCRHMTSSYMSYCFILADIVGVSSNSLGLLLLVRCGSHALATIGVLANGSLIDICNFLQRISFGLFTLSHGEHKTSPSAAKQDKLCLRFYASQLPGQSGTKPISTNTTFMCKLFSLPLQLLFLL